MHLDFSGVWKANLEKSNILGARPKAMTVKIAYSDPALLVEMVITQMNEIEDRLAFRGLTSGEEVTNFSGHLTGAESLTMGRNGVADRIMDELWRA